MNKYIIIIGVCCCCMASCIKDAMQDFTKGSVAYTVTSQDGEWKRTYNVTFQEAPLPAEKYNFEHVETQTEKTMLSGTNELHVFYEQTGNEHPLSATRFGVPNSKCLGVSADLNWGLTGIFPGDFKTVEQTLYPVYGTIGVFYRLK